MTELGYDPQGRPVMPTEKRTCVACGQSRPESLFRMIKGYRMKKCRACESAERRRRQGGGY